MIKQSPLNIKDHLNFMLQKLKLTRRKTINLLITGILILVVGLTIFQIQNQQDLRGKAAEFGSIEAEQGVLSNTSSFSVKDDSTASANKFVEFINIDSMAPSAPTISTISCSNNYWVGRISWTGTPNPNFGFYVDISETNAFTTYMHKLVGTGNTTDTSGFGSAPYGGEITFPITSGKTYYFRVFNEYPTVYDHGPVSSFTIPTCTQPTPTLTLVPTATPTRAPTPTTPIISNNTVSIYAAGTAADNVYPTMELSVNGQTVKTFQNVSGNPLDKSTGYNVYSYTHPTAVSPSQVRVSFTNDGSNSTQDRNLWVDKIVIGNTTYETEATDTYSSGAWNNNDGLGCGVGFRQTELLACNGYFSFKNQATITPSPTSEQGLSGAYYTGKNFNTYKATRIDKTINFNWETSDPISGVNSDNYSVRWTGFLKPKYSQVYTFYVKSDDGARLWVNNKLIINKWYDHSAQEFSGKILLEKSKTYPIKLEYYENGGNSEVYLSWSSPSQPKQIIPQSQLSTKVLGVAHAQTNCPVTIPSGTPSITLPPLAITSTGTYTLWARMKASSQDNTKNSFYITVDGGCPIMVGGFTPAESISSSEWTWVDRDNNSRPITLPFESNSNHIITVYPRSTGVKLDKILVTKDATCKPTGFGENCLINPSPTPTVRVTPTPTVTVPTPTSIVTPTVPPSGGGVFKVTGNKIVDPQGRDWLMRGMAYPSQEWSCTGEGKSGQLGQDDINRIAVDWKANTVRFAITSPRWYGRRECTAEYYRNKLDQVIKWANDAGMVAIIDHHGRNDNDEQVCMANNEMLNMWREIARKYKGNSAVFFELFNEPRDISWNVWRNGGQIACSNQNEQGIGMQQIADAIRAEGANNILIVGGLNWGYDLSQINKDGNYKLNGSNIVYSTHPYDFGGKQPSNWENDYGYLTSTYPVVSTEFGPIAWGGYGCRIQYMRDILSYFDNKNIGYTGWGWHPGNGNDDCNFPSLINNWDGVANPRGQLIKDNISNYRNRIGY